MSYQGASSFRRFRGGFPDPPPAPEGDQYPADGRPANDTAAYTDPASYQPAGGHGERYVYQSATGRLNRPDYQDPSGFQAPTGSQGPVIFQNPAAPPAFGARPDGAFRAGPEGAFGAVPGTEAGFGAGAGASGLADPTAYQGLGSLQDQPFPEMTGYQVPDQEPATAFQEDRGPGWTGGGRRGGHGGHGGHGILAGGAAGFLAGAVAIGVAMLAAAFVRPQASPVIAVGEAAIDRTPSAVKEFAIQYFGENDKTMLLTGMYVVIAIIAMGIGVLALRRLVYGVIGMAGFGVFGAFIALTRPESHTSDVVPSLIGGVAGIAALALLVWAAAPRGAGRTGVTGPARRDAWADPTTTRMEVTR